LYNGPIDAGGIAHNDAEASFDEAFDKDAEH
jgi:hypothetical protein